MKTQISIDHWGSKQLVRVLALLLILAVAPSMLLAQQWGERNGRDKVDPTGAWLLKWGVVAPPIFPDGIFVLEVFHQGGTLTGDNQGESAFDPAATTNKDSDLNVITTPHSGEWQRTSRKTFVATFMTIEYHVVSAPTPGAPIFQFGQVQYKGTLTDSNHMDLKVVITHFDSEGKKKQESGPFNKFEATGVRIPLKDVAELELPVLPE